MGTRASDRATPRLTLMEPLTELVVAGRGRHSRRQPVRDEGRWQARRIAGNRSRSRRRPDHWPRTGAAGARRYRSLSEERVELARPPYQRQLLPGRSARRHQGIRRRPQRIHGQSGAGDRRNATARHRRRAGARADLARAGRPRRRAADGAATTSRGATEPIRTRNLPGRGKPWIVAVSRSHGDPRSEAFIAAGPARSAKGWDRR